MLLHAINPAEYDAQAIAKVAMRSDVRAAARQANMSPVEFVRKNLEQAEPKGLQGLGFSFSDTAQSIMNLYTQYKSAGPAPAPVIVQAPAAPAQVATSPAQASPWYSNMSIMIPVVGGLSVLAALLLRRKKKS